MGSCLEFNFKCILRWNLKNLSRGLNPPKPGLNYVEEQLGEFNKKLDEINKSIENEEVSKNLFSEILQ